MHGITTHQLESEEQTRRAQIAADEQAQQKADAYWSWVAVVIGAVIVFLFALVMFNEKMVGVAISAFILLVTGAILYMIEKAKRGQK